MERKGEGGGGGLISAEINLEGADNQPSVADGRWSTPRTEDSRDPGRESRLGGDHRFCSGCQWNDGGLAC